MAETAAAPVEEAAPARQSPDSVHSSAAESKPDEPAKSSRTATPVQANGSPPPIMTNTNRPPSVNSSHSATSAGGTRSTTTSRRGGRIRSRSPPTMVNRSGPAPADRNFMAGDPAAGEGHNPPLSPKNPSSVAASAAAAAKALSSGRNKAWNDQQRDRENPRYPGYDGNSYAGPRHWPVEEHAVGQRGFEGNRPPQAVHLGGPYEHERSYGEGPHHPKRRHPDHRVPFDGRPGYEGGRYENGRNVGPLPESFIQDPRAARMQDPRQDYYNGQGMNQQVDNSMPLPVSYNSPKGSGPPDTETMSTVKRKGGTSRVIGTPTPIHVPRAADPPDSAYPPQGTAASVFRGRTDKMPTQDVPVQPEDNTPQRILLSLRTPTTSFEESKPPSTKRTQKKKGRPGPPLSPEEPPKIQHAHHQNNADQPLFFEPQRSPRSQGVQLQSSGTLEMAPSFSLFSQSFDSLGDAANYLTAGVPLDTAFQSYSFGAGPTNSGDNDNGPVQLLPINRDTSFGGGVGQRVGSNSQQFLGGSSSGGMFTFGMSPANSFGNGPALGQSRNRGNMMVLGGGDDGRPPSPTQVLGMYPSYSGGYGSQASMQAPFRSMSGPMGDGQDRTLSVGSFGPTMSQIYTRSFEGPHPGSYPGSMGPLRSQDAMSGPISFYPFLRRNKAAFIKCTFLLPGLKAALLESPLSDQKEETGDDTSGKESSDTGSAGKKKGQAKAEAALAQSGRGYLEPSPQDTAIAMRRIVSSVCAFGGGVSGDRSTTSQDNQASGNSSNSIFRAKNDDMQPGHATVTPSSSSGTPPGNRQTSRAKVKYDELLPTRYYENENRLSWEFEETPPVGSITDDEGGNGHANRRKRDGDDMSTNEDDEDHMTSSSPTPDDSTSGILGDDNQKSDSPDQPKMRYRCKLCGLPKQNHTCPYQQSLQRSIGTMVYPAVNAFTSNEPGMLAPALTDMNNFINSGSESQSSPDTSPDRPSPGRRGAQRATTPGATGAHNVTPETLRSSTQNSPGSVSLSTGSGTPQRTPFRTPRSAKRKSRATPNANLSGGVAMSQRVGSGSSPGRSGGLRKRQHSQMSDDQSTDLLFVDAVDLRPEQFRIITPTKHTRADAYTYPALPLPYAQRKRLSDNLFALSKEIPQLTDECAVVLREAREKDMWDLAVAELMTQVVIVIHCHDGDTRFEGLRQYLLTLGIAC